MHKARWFLAATIMCIVTCVAIQSRAADEIIKIVDPDGGAGYDYLSLAAWETAEAKDLVTADEQATVKCRCTGGTADVTALTLSANWTTSATCFIKIWTDSTESYRHAGTYPSGNKYRLEPSSGTRAIGTGTTVGHVKIIGLAITPVNGSWTYGIEALGNNAVGSWVYVEQNIIRGNYSGGKSGMRGISCAQWGTKKYVSNNIVYDVIDGANTACGIRCTDASTRGQYLYNNTVQNCRRGFRTDAGEAIFKNCLAQDCSDSCFIGSTGFSGSDSSNCSDDNSQPGANGQNGEVLFENEAADDFHLDSSDTVAKDNGMDLSGDGNYPITIDIDGETRSGSWDIGADETAAAAAAGQVIIIH